MTQKTLLYLVAGVLFVTILSTAGAIASRKFNFKYAYLTIVSIILYLSVGYLTGKHDDIQTAILSCVLLGLYDGTISYWLCIKFKATGTEKLPPSVNLPTVVMMLFFGAITGMLGAALSTAF